MAKGLAEALCLPFISASGWVRSHFGKEASIADLTAYSQEQLRQNSSACLDHLRAQYDLSSSCIIEGIRNPFDFIHLFDAKRDLVISLHYVTNPTQATLFETGLEVIEHYLKWLEQNALFASKRRLSLTFSDFQGLLTKSLSFVQEAS